MPRSQQQEAVIQWVESGRGNAFVTAVAGAGKTTTLIDAIEVMVRNPRNSIAFAAFNKAIADEVKGKLEKRGLLSTKVRVGTFHSFGFSAWRKAYPGVKTEDDMPRGEKKWDIIQARAIAKLSEQDQISAEAAKVQIEKMWDVVRKLCSYAKADGLRPEFFGNMAIWYKYVDHFGVADEIEDPDMLGRAINIARFAMVVSIKLAHQIVDFDDMLYMPVISGIQIWQNDWLLVDEAQDTNPVRMALARRMVREKWGRAIFVGDPRQAIYGFSGADAEAVENIKRDFRAADLPLTITFRCPKAVVKAAQAYVSHIEAAPTAPEGAVNRMELAQFEMQTGMLGPDDAILCRNTRPLVSMAFSLLNRGIACKVEGKDIGQGLKALLKKWKISEWPTYEDRLDSWTETKVNKFVAQKEDYKAEALLDQVGSLKVIARGCHLVSEIVSKIETLFGDGIRGVLTLATVHRSKGREWGTVYLLGQNRYMPSPAARSDWALLQEDNLVYVAYTRAQERLVLVDVPWED